MFYERTKFTFKALEIKVPVTFWQGEKDNNVPFQWAELMNNQISQANLKTFPSEGHLIIFGHAEEIFTDLIPEKRERLQEQVKN